MKPRRILEPQVVSIPSVRKMSFSATGTPSRRPSAARFERRWSDARAAAYAPFSSTLRNAFTLGSKRSIRFRQARVASSDEASRLESFSPSSSIDRSLSSIGVSFQNLGNRDAGSDLRRSVGERPIRLQARQDPILAQQRLGQRGVGGGLDAVGVQGVQRFDCLENRRELVLVDLLFLGSERNAGQRGDVAHLLEGEPGHDRFQNAGFRKMLSTDFITAPLSCVPRAVSASISPASSQTPWQ